MSKETVIRTQSPIMAWCLRKFWKMELRAVYSTPLVPILGAVLYSRCWVLVASAPVHTPLAHL